MTSSFAKDCLSPALRSTSMRRRSLEICQQIGTQLISPNLLQQLSPSSSPKTPSPSSSIKSSPGSTTKSSTSPFKLLDDNKPKLTSQSPVFNFSISEQSNSVSTSVYRSRRRASDSFWLVDNRQDKLVAFQNDQELFQKTSLALTHQHLSCSVTANNNKEKRGDSKAKSGSEKSAQRCACTAAAVCDDVSESKQAGANRKGTSVITCNIIPPTPLKAVCEPGKARRASMAPLHCSIGSNNDSSSDSENAEENGLENMKTDQMKTHTCRFELAKEYVPANKLLRRCSAGAKYDLDDTLIKLVALHWNLSLNLDELLGKGSFGTVIAGQYEGKEVAVKVLKTTNPQRKASVLGEDNGLNLPFHNHIARTLDIFQLGPDRALIIMEKMHKGNLLTLLNDPSFQINCSTAINISKQVALALIFCHRQGLLHLDVKPQNILVDVRNCCKLSDFGSSKKINDLEDCYKFSQLEGTIPYTAPELFKGDRPTEKCDVYSFAITMWQIITRETPYEEENEHAVIFRVVSQGLRPGNNNEPNFSGNDEEKKSVFKYVQLYEECWNANPVERPTVVDAHTSLLKIQFSI